MDARGGGTAPTATRKSRILTARRSVLMGGKNRAVGKQASRREGNGAVRNPPVLSAPIHPPSLDQGKSRHLGHFRPGTAANLIQSATTPWRILPARDGRSVQEGLGRNPGGSVGAERGPHPPDPRSPDNGRGGRTPPIQPRPRLTGAAAVRKPSRRSGAWKSPPLPSGYWERGTGGEGLSQPPQNHEGHGDRISVPSVSLCEPRGLQAYSPSAAATSIRPAP